MNNRDRILLVACLCLILVGPACHRTKSPQAKRYPFTGRILSTDANSGTAVIDGDTVKNFMLAMTMTYKIKPPSAVRQLAPGDAISAEVVVIAPDASDPEAESDYWLENVKVTSHAAAPPASGPKAMHTPQPGEDVPDFAFTNQDGKPISLHQYRGKVLLVTFIYTRCPFADFCPRMSSNFQEIYSQLDRDSSTRLLSVSFDPEHDRPKVLREYAFSVAHTHDRALFRRWEFAVPSTADLPRIADFFALTATPEGGLITHNLSTTVIGADGKIAKWYHGGDWQVSDLIKEAAEAGVPKA